MPQNKYSLDKLRLDEISLVDNPANEQARVVLHKRKDDNMPGDKPMTDAEKAKMKEYTDKGMSEKDATAEVFRTMRKDAGDPGPTDNPEETNTMDVKELEAKLAGLESQVQTLSKAATDHGLTIAKADDGTITVTKAAEPEYVEFAGERVAKSALPEPVLKALTEQAAKIAKMEAEADAEKLAKRAETELPNLAGTVAEKAAVLKAVDALPEADRASAMKVLKAADAATSAMFKEVGKAAGSEDNPAQSELDTLVSKFAEDKGVSKEQAFSEVTKSGKGRELYATIRKTAN